MGDFGINQGIGQHFIGSLLHSGCYYYCSNTNEYSVSLKSTESLYYNWNTRKFNSLPILVNNLKEPPFKLIITLDDKDIEFVAKIGIYKTYCGMKTQLCIDNSRRVHDSSWWGLNKTKRYIKDVQQFNSKYSLHVNPASITPTEMIDNGYNNFEKDFLAKINDVYEYKINLMKTAGKQIVQDFISDNPEYTPISYSDLFFKLKDTDTLLDNYKEQIQEYTKANIKLVEKLNIAFNWD